MYTLSSLITLVAASVTIVAAVPHPGPRQQVYVTNGTFYIEPPSSETEYCGEDAVGPFNITSGVCDQSGTYSGSIQPLVDRTCRYTVFHNTQNCMNPSSQEVYDLPRGGEQVCVTFGIYNPSERLYNSGRLEC